MLLIPTLMVVHVAIVEVVWRHPRWRRVAVAAVALVGVGWPLTYMPGILERDHAYQRQVVTRARAILDTDETYLAGNDLIYDRRQPLAALRRLSTPHLEDMKQWPPERVDALIGELEKARPKLVIDDIRMRLMPAPLRAYFDRRFATLWPSINVYAPVVSPGETAFDLWFDGDYLVEPSSGSAVVDGVTIPREAWSHFSAALTATAAHRRCGFACNRRALHLLRTSIPAGHRPMFARAYDY